MFYFGPTNDKVSSLLWIYFKNFFKIFHNESGKDVHENWISGFSKKKILFRAMVPFGPKNDDMVLSLLWVCFKDFFKILHRERGPETRKLNKWFAWKNSCLGHMDHFWPKYGMRPHNSESALKIF